MTYKPHYDRTEWRSLSTQTLIYAAQDCPNELAIALGERLEELEGFGTHAANLEKEVLDLQHAQRMYNYWTSQEAEMLALAPTRADLEKEVLDLQHAFDIQEKTIADLQAEIAVMEQTLAEHEAALGYDQ